MADPSITYYLAGPMSGLPQFNYPTFFEVAKVMRAHGFNVISPAEQDSREELELILASPDGDLSKVPNSRTWGDFLSHDVKLIADKVKGIAFLPGWQKSRGARLEAYVGLICGHSLIAVEAIGDTLIARPLTAEYVKQEIFDAI